MWTLLNDGLQYGMRRVLIDANVFQLGHADLQQHLFDMRVGGCQSEERRRQDIVSQRCATAEKDFQKIDELSCVIGCQLQDEIVRERFPSVDDGILRTTNRTSSPACPSMSWLIPRGF